MQKLESETIEKILLNLEEKDMLPGERVRLVKKNGKPFLLGKGGFSFVYEAYSDSVPEKHYALKAVVLEDGTKAANDYIHSIEIQKSLQEKCDNVVRIISDGIISFARDISFALLAASESNILHRDIKLENIFYDEENKRYKLGDFGNAKISKEAGTIIGTKGYVAPEIKNMLSDSYGEEADIYSFGVTLFLLMNGLKFPGSETYHYSRAQYNEGYVFPLETDIIKKDYQVQYIEDFIAAVILSFLSFEGFIPHSKPLPFWNIIMLVLILISAAVFIHKKFKTASLAFATLGIGLLFFDLQNITRHLAFLHKIYDYHIGIIFAALFVFVIASYYNRLEVLSKLELQNK